MSLLMETQNKTTNKFIISALIALNIFFSVKTLAHDHSPEEQAEIDAHEDELYELEDYSFMPEAFRFDKRGCIKATKTQKSTVNQGNARKTEFENSCIKKTGSAKWCKEIERPNPSSKATFNCTYGSSQPHLLIHPNSTTWKNAHKAIELVQRLSSTGICVSQIYNWWRPEPYNKNVGGAAGRHPFGTSIDVRFCSNNDAIKAFDTLCKYRKKGEVRALGYYGSTGVHIGVGDKSANTWGRNCK